MPEIMFSSEHTAQLSITVSSELAITLHFQLRMFSSLYSITNEEASLQPI